MKYLILLSLLSISASFSSCKKVCIEDKKCSEQPETGPTCDAYFENWVYNPKKEKCEYIGYSGCSPIGFDDEAECNECKCE